MLETEEEADSWYEDTQPTPAPHSRSGSTVQPLPAGPLVPGTCPGVGLVVVVVVVVVVVAAVVPVDGVVEGLGTVGRTGGVQSVRVEGVGRGRAGPGGGASPLGLGGAPGPAGSDND